MASKESRTIEVLLNGIDLASFGSAVRNGRHLVTVELLCPRPLVAAKSAVRTFRFSEGVLDCATLSWCRRIYFKESVEFRFGLCVRVSQSVTRAYVEEFLRYFAGAAMGMGADAAEDAFPGPAGDLAAIPLDYAKKKLQAVKDAAIITEGAVDLLPSELPESGEIAVPLCAMKDSRRPGAAAGRLLHAEGDRLGTARVQINILKG